MPCTTACSPYTMTLPGAETMKGGIMGDDCFRSKVGAPFLAAMVAGGRLPANWAGIEVMAVCVECEDVVSG